MFESVFSAIDREVSAKLAFEELKAVHQIDRWFSSSAFEESARYAVGRWKSFGLSRVEAENFRADGRTKVGSWIMPYAWDVESAALTISEPDELAGTVIARYRETPSSLSMWSGPTPKNGIEADLVLVEDADEAGSYRGRNVRDNVVLTSTRGVFAKGLAAAKGAAGLVSDFVPHRCDLVHENFWMNAWSDDPGGWGLHGGDSRIFGFNISPYQGQWLRALLKEHGRLRVKAVVRTRLYRGEIPVVTAVIPGIKRNEEVLILGHGFEQGANDNASGCAVMLEAARALSKLIRDGRLPRPRRTIRFLLVSECYSNFAYCLKHPDRMQSTLAALCVDSVAQRQDLCRTFLGIHRPPEANASFVSAYSRRLATKVFDPWRASYNWKMLPYETTDNIIADPMIGPPTVLFSSPSDIYWHTTGDTPDKVDVWALGRITKFAATYLYTIANAGAMHALYFAALAGAEARGRLSEMAAITLERCLGEGSDDFPLARASIIHEAETGSREVHSVRAILNLREAKSIEKELSKISGGILSDGERYVAHLEQVLSQCGALVDVPARSPSAERLMKRARKLIPHRKSIGSMAYDTVDPQKRKGHPDVRWDTGITTVLFWCDGSRTLAAAIEAAGRELRRDLSALVKEFEFMAEVGLIELKKAKG